MRSTGYTFLVPACALAPTMAPSRSGYTRRRSGDAGPARRVRGGRKTSFSGCATGSPSGDTEETRGFRTKTLRFISGHERRACLCGTQGTGGLFGFSSPFVRPDLFREGRWQKNPVPCPAERAVCVAKTAERGAERCHSIPNSTRQLSAPGPMSVKAGSGYAARRHARGTLSISCRCRHPKHRPCARQSPSRRLQEI
jgi:hypothetical protein